MTSPPGHTQKEERCIQRAVCAWLRGSWGCQCERVWKKATPLVALTQQVGSAAHEHEVEAELSSRPPPNAATLSSRSTSLRMSLPATCAPW